MDFRVFAAIWSFSFEKATGGVGTNQDPIVKAYLDQPCPWLTANDEKLNLQYIYVV